MQNVGKRPILVFDGDCGFCRHCISAAQQITRGRVDYRTAQDMGDEVTGAAASDFDKSVVLVEPDKSLKFGANAVFDTLVYGPWGFQLFSWIYTKSSLFRSFSEGSYRKVASNRRFFSSIVKGFRYLGGAAHDYRVMRRIFLKGLGCIYAVAFASLIPQAIGLWGRNGILPIDGFLKMVSSSVPGSVFLALPSVFWLNASDGAITLLPWLGVGASLAIVFGFSPRIFLFLTWLFYLSFVSAGQSFLSFQWDLLLLETGFLSIFFAPMRWARQGQSETPPSKLVIFLYRLLLFRLIFASGLVKFAGHDAMWSAWMALTVHYQTQPLPHFLSWYAHHLPAWFHTLSTMGVYVVEVMVPVLVFFNQRVRWVPFWAISALMGLILMTGNYCFFNLLAILLCFTLLDDVQIKRLFPAKVWSWVAKPTILKMRHPYAAMGLFVVTVVMVLLTTSLEMHRFLGFQVQKPLVPLYRQARSFYLFGGYGLFANMTTVRREIVIEGSLDGNRWESYVFKWKPSRLDLAPKWIQPYHPRLDWQMWFAALGDYRSYPWFNTLLWRLMNGESTVTRLFETDPFEGTVPKYIRAKSYIYTFSSPEQRKLTGQWWVRNGEQAYTPTFANPQ
ncbi:MAG: putative DCC family thiol-disulfide oxidoreductase YuxK [Candidatus Marinamargulisbacteria bacterium]|jgi:predicted DCC family thiol-disulfide oxidoreductase YuxK